MKNETRAVQEAMAQLKVTEYSTTKQIRIALELLGVDTKYMKIRKQARSTKITPACTKAAAYVLHRNKDNAVKMGFGLDFFGQFDKNDRLIGEPTSVRISISVQEYC